MTMQVPATPKYQIVLDTNVVRSALWSRTGASFRLLSLVGSGTFEINLSVPLALEYEDVLRRPELGLTPEEVGDVLDYLCAAANLCEILFSLAPVSQGPKDEMILELAVTAGCDYIVTYNEKDFSGVERFGLRTIRPAAFLKLIGTLP